VFVPVSVVTFASGFAYAAWTVLDAVARDQLVGAAYHAVGRDLLVGLVSEQILRLRFESRQ